MSWMLPLFAFSVAVLAYVYVGYPVLLRALVRIRGTRPIKRANVTPPMSLVISAYNEAGVIRRKIENALALTYPTEALEIVVVSDASSDGTDGIVAEYASRGVRLMRQTERRGKTAGLNRTVPALQGEIVVFSDANAMYEPDALLKLARNFADPEIGCVTGEARYLSQGRTAADIGERAYWDYEIHIKRCETALGSMVGGDGAIYAIRRALWRELPEDAINDFLNPLQIVAAGWRAVYESEAVCYEETGGGMRTEFRRRVRIVSRSWRAVFQAPGVLNPVRMGFFTWCLVSHKILRWLSGIFTALAAAISVVLALQAAQQRPGVMLGVASAAAAALILTRVGRQLAAMLTYFAIINTASCVGIWKGSTGRVTGIWATPRQKPGRGAPGRGVLVPSGTVLQVAGVLILTAVVAGYVVLPTDRFAAVVFWCSSAVLGYVYVGYPLILAVLRLIATRPVRRQDIEPGVCFFITANDEATVIEAKLQNTLELNYPAASLDIVVASDGSLDDTNAIVRRFAGRVRLLEFSPRRGKIAAINEGMQHVTSDIVVFSDANTFLVPDAVRALVRSFADPEVGAVSGDVSLIGERAALGRSEDLYYRYERWMQHAESEIGSMIGADGALYAIRRELFAAPAHDTILDDMAIPMAVIRAGHRVVFEQNARGLEQGSETALEEFARKSRVIAGAMQFMSRQDSDVPLARPQVIFSLVSHKVVRWLSPLFVASTLLSSLVLTDTSSWYRAAVAVQTAVLGLGLAGCSPALRRLNVVAIAHYFFLVHAAAAVGFLRGLSGRQSVLWKRFARLSARSRSARPRVLDPAPEPYGLTERNVDAPGEHVAAHRAETLIR